MLRRNDGTRQDFSLRNRYVKLPCVTRITKSAIKSGGQSRGQHQNRHYGPYGVESEDSSRGCPLPWTCSPGNAVGTPRQSRTCPPTISSPPVYCRSDDERSCRPRSSAPRCIRRNRAPTHPADSLKEGRAEIINARVYYMYALRRDSYVIPFPIEGKTRPSDQYLDQFFKFKEFKFFDFERIHICKREYVY